MVAAKGCPTCSRQGYGARSSRPRGASFLLLGLAAWVPRGRRSISSSSRKPPNCSVSPTPKSPRQRSFRSPTRRASTSLLPPASRLSPVCIGTVGSQGNLFRSWLNEILRCGLKCTTPRLVRFGMHYATYVLDKSALYSYASLVASERKLRMTGQAPCAVSSARFPAWLCHLLDSRQARGRRLHRPTGRVEMLAVGLLHVEGCL